MSGLPPTAAMRIMPRSWTSRTRPPITRQSRSCRPQSARALAIAASSVLAPTFTPACPPAPTATALQPFVAFPRRRDRRLAACRTRNSTPSWQQARKAVETKASADTRQGDYAASDGIFDGTRAFHMKLYYWFCWFFHRNVTASPPATEICRKHCARFGWCRSC